MLLIAYLIRQRSFTIYTCIISHAIYIKVTAQKFHFLKSVKSIFSVALFPDIGQITNPYWLVIVTKNGKIVWKHGPNWPFYAVMLRTKNNQGIKM